MLCQNVWEVPFGITAIVRADEEVAGFAPPPHPAAARRRIAASTRFIRCAPCERTRPAKAGRYGDE
jgi:hypothetical protein